MPHEPKPVPTGNKFKDKRALKQYNKEHKRQSDYNKRNVGTAREIAHEGTYTSGGRHLLGMKPVEGGYFTSEAPTTEQIPFEGPYSIAQQEINNLAWVMENKNISDQELNMLEEAKLMLENRLELGIDADLTYNNQIAKQNMNAQEFFGTGIQPEEPIKPEEPPAVINKAVKLSNQNDSENPVASKKDLDNEKIIATNEPKPISAGYQRPSPSERHKRRMEDIMVRGRPGEKFKLDRERGRGTNIDDLFTKNRE